MLARHKFQIDMDNLLDRHCPDDLRPLVRKIGTGFEAHYRVPWGVRVVNGIDGKPERYDTAAQAFVAATGALLTEFRDRTTGWRRNGPSKARMAAEELFKRPEKGELT